MNISTKSLAFLRELVHTFSVLCVCEYAVAYPHNCVYIAYTGITSCFHFFSSILWKLEIDFFNK